MTKKRMTVVKAKKNGTEKALKKSIAKRRIPPKKVSKSALPPMVVFVAQSKGGVGKSTLAINLASYFLEKGTVYLYDVDEGQGTSLNWAMDREENSKLRAIPATLKNRNIKQDLLRLKEKYDYVVVDGSAKDSREMRLVLEVADQVLIPCQPTQPDLDTIGKMRNMVCNAQKKNTSLVPHIVLTRVISDKSAAEAQKSLGNYFDMNPLQSFIRDREIYQTVMPFGQSVVESKSKAAVSEFRKVVEEMGL